MKIMIAYIITLILMVGIDLLWLGKIAKPFYYAQLGDLLLPKPNLLAAFLFYNLYVIGILFFATLPALREMNWKIAALNGAMLGFIAYATYDLTNWATLRRWPAALVPVDIAWGTALTALVAVAGYAATARFSRFLP